MNNGIKLRQSLALALLALTMSGCGQKGGKPPEQMPEVSVITIQTERLPLIAELPGRIDAVRKAQVRARVSGILLKQEVKGGSEVKAGDILFRIDPAPLLAAYHTAQANQQKAVAIQSEARAKAQRYQKLVKFKAVSQLEFINATGDAKQADASVAAAKATVETAKLNLDYATVRAPIDGRIGTPQVTEGALVGQNEATLLATIQQMDPVYLDLTQSSADFLRLKRAFDSGKLKGLNPGEANVSLILEDGSVYPATGKLLFTDVSVDPSTDMLKLRVEFANPQHLLLPGMYARAKLEQAIDNNAITVLQRALNRSQNGDATVMVVGSDGKVAARTVKVGDAVGDKWIVTEGLQAGDKVIIEGLQKVQPGAKVKTVPFTAQAPIAAASANK